MSPELLTVYLRGLPNNTIIGRAVHNCLRNGEYTDHIVIMLLKCIIENREAMENLLGEKLFKGVLSYEP